MQRQLPARFGGSLAHRLRSQHADGLRDGKAGGLVGGDRFDPESVAQLPTRGM